MQKTVVVKIAYLGLRLRSVDSLQEFSRLRGLLVGVVDVGGFEGVRGTHGGPPTLPRASALCGRLLGVRITRFTVGEYLKIHKKAKITTKEEIF